MQVVVDEVRRHYDEQEQPYYLAELGQFFRSKGIEIPPGQRFKNFLAESFQGRLVVVQDPAVPAKIAISLPDKGDQVQERLAGKLSLTPGRPPIEVNRLPFSLIVAFCQVPSSDLRVFYRTIRPCRYVVSSVAPDNSYIEIGENFRKALPPRVSIHELSNGVKQDIFRRIDEWTAGHNVNLESIYVEASGRSPILGIKNRIPISNALQRLIEAQEPELRQRIQIPGDIALVLMHVE